MELITGASKPLYGLVFWCLTPCHAALFPSVVLATGPEPPEIQKPKPLSPAPRNPLFWCPSHWPKDGLLDQEIARVLKPGGNIGDSIPPGLDMLHVQFYVVIFMIMIVYD